MLSLLRDETQEKAVRFEAAKAAAPYIHPRLASTEMKANLNISHEDALASLE